ncbi:OstA family protein [Candidatus Liberibacter africanus]|uniref:OstA family protein n=1 Tax=Candidatus Liberibacter africanus PTSAPSY TaxID=1277257 RepID=A0A0G3I6D6_LIBAF|nr:LptA/OstA family protein [Candidatus Liberibacter africanus]AKK20038.1 OstA family protein [Candidatus Liberibacter africanus PTSAPSY]QTP63862.1 OstA family protein [Candidatus Liberibacter africanus]
MSFFLNNIRKHLVTLAFVLLTFNLSQASNPYVTRFKVFGNEKIHIKSDVLEIKDVAREALFLGNVLVTQGDFVLKSEKMTVYYQNKNHNDGNKIDRMDIERNIVIKSGDITSMASNGYFDFQKRVMVLVGDHGQKVVLRENKNTFWGCKLIVNLDTNLANLQGCGSDQVKSIIHYN